VRGLSSQAERAVRARRGMTLLELLVSIGIMLMLTAVMVPTVSGVLMLEQRASARNIAILFEQLHDEAVLRNRTLRIAFDLDRHSYKVETGEAGVTIYTDPEARTAFEEREEDFVEQLDPEEREEYLKHVTFQAYEDGQFAKEVSLPPNTRFKMVYTPQYEEPVTPREADDKGKGKDDDDEEPRVVYSYLFANGFAEYTVVQLVDADDEESGYTIVVDPLSGKVEFVSELVDQHDRFEFIPDEGPRLSQ
jgi:prepilin-type N-terminal cleavage/methylation domain-containing protein